MTHPELEVGDRVCRRSDVDQKTANWRIGTVIEKQRSANSEIWFYTIRWDGAQDIASHNFTAAALYLFERPKH